MTTERTARALCGSTVSGMDETALLTCAEAAQLLRISERTMRQCAEAGEVRSYRIRGQWRFHREHLLEDTRYHPEPAKD